jgi:hypothetical protein
MRTDGQTIGEANSGTVQARERCCKLEGRIEMTGRRGRRRRQLLDDLKEKKRYWKLKEEALDRTM